MQGLNFDIRRLHTHTSDKMEVLTLLLIFLTVSGHSYVLQPSLTVTQMAGLARDHASDMMSEQLHDPSISVKEKENAAESTERMKTDEEEQTSEGLTPETNPEKEKRMAPETFLKSLGEVTERGEFSADVTDLDTNKEVERREDGLNVVSRSESVKAIPTGNTETLEKVDQIDKLKQEKVEEEREGKLVAGIHLQEEIRGESMQTVNHENVADKGGNGEKEGHMVISNLAPPLSTSSTQLGEESVIPATIQIITQSQNPPGSPPPVHQHNVPPSPTQVPPVSSHPPVPYDKVSPPNPTTISHMPTVLPGESRSVFLLEDLLTEVLQNPLLKQNHLDVKASPNLEDVMAKNILFKPARKEQQTVIVQPKETEFIPEVPAATPKPKAAKFITKDLKEPNPQAKSTVKPQPSMSQPAAKPKTLKLMENDTKPTVKQNKSPPPQPQLTKPSARPRLAAAKTPSTRPTKINRSSKNKTIKKSKEKKRKKDNKTQKPSERKKKVIAPTHFPYFKDNYCPPECACYGRVVQCSDKGVDKVPYGIPYNARYILLMNNHIDMIQLDLLNEYVSMEFLVLSNNRLTDGAIEGAFEGIPALKRLYLDRNLLNSVPTDLPVSLEELRLDNNQLSVMSEAAWARCPGLLVLSLSNNSLGNGSESLPDGVLAPLGNLRTLNLDHNQLTSVPLGLPLSIKELYIRGNIIEQFRSGAFDGISDLVVLDLSANRLTNKGLLRDSLLNTTHLESLNLAGNRLKQVPRHLPRSLKTLNLEGNLISSIKKATFGTLKNLEHLGLARNKIFKVAPGAFRTLPALHQLDLCHNTLRQVPRQLPEALHSVALTHNKIESVPRDAFCWGNNSLSGLVRVQLEHNLMDMGRLDAQAFRCLRGFQVVHFY